MPKYLFRYHGGTMPQTPEEGQKVMAAWTKWLGDLGPKAIDRGNPTSTSQTVGAGGKVTANGGANPVNGYSVIEADNLDAALAIARNCPQIAANGTVEVGELMAM
jgi:hypothetical protein